MKSQQIQAAIARRREAEHIRVEKNEAVNRYFDHWGKVTSRFESWTTPEYYQQANMLYEKEQDKKVKEKSLDERRARLRNFLEIEDNEYKNELNLMKRQKSRRIPTDVLNKINDNIKYMEEERRRIELESKLYGRWRYGITDEKTKSIFDSKSNHETMAKLNWLDKQIEETMRKEQEKKESEERQLRMHEEVNKREEFLKERQKIRESEIKEMRLIQESHMNELKMRETDLNKLHEDEILFKDQLEMLRKELSVIVARRNEELFSIPASYNIKRIKMVIRERSALVRQELRKDIDLLERVARRVNDVHVRNLIEQLEMQYDAEIQSQSQIEAMYESEAKSGLNKWEEVWKQQAKMRRNQIVDLLDKQKASIESKLSENVNKQKVFVGVRETHLSAIENSNEKLKMLTKETEAYLPKSGDNATMKIGGNRNSSVNATTTTTAHVQFDGGASKNDSLSEKVSNFTINSDALAIPKFGRKKVAWT